MSRARFGGYLPFFRLGWSWHVVDCFSVYLHWFLGFSWWRPDMACFGGYLPWIWGLVCPYPPRHVSVGICFYFQARFVKACCGLFQKYLPSFFMCICLVFQARLAHTCLNIYLPWFLGLICPGSSRAILVCICLGFRARLVLAIGAYFSRYFPCFLGLVGHGPRGPVLRCFWLGFQARLVLACQIPFRWVFALVFEPSTSRPLSIYICLGFWA